MLNIAICDDVEQLEQTEETIVAALFNENELNIDLYDTEEEFEKVITNKGINYDMIFIGIRSEKATGLKLAELIRQYNLNCEIIFVALNSSFVFSVFRYNPFDYLIRPIEKQTMFDLMERYNYYHNNKTEEFFSFKCGSEEDRIKIKSILYFYSVGRKIIIVTNDRQFEFYSKLDDVETVLEDSSFIRVHQSYLVNFSYIKYIIHNEVVLENNDYLPISRNRLKDVKEKYLELIR